MGGFSSVRARDLVADFDLCGQANGVRVQNPVDLEFIVIIGLVTMFAGTIEPRFEVLGAWDPKNLPCGRCVNLPKNERVRGCHLVTI